MNEAVFEEMSMEEVDQASGGLQRITAMEAVGLIGGLVGLAASSPVVLGVGLGAMAGLTAAWLLSE